MCDSPSRQTRLAAGLAVQANAPSAGLAVQANAPYGGTRRPGERAFGARAVYRLSGVGLTSRKYNLGLDTHSTTPQAKPSQGGGHAAAVAAGILLSRLVGLVRERVFAHYFGTSDAAGAFRAAFRIPNILVNLFGEGVLSASFIPVYARLNAEDRHEEASQLAEAVFALLLVVTTLLVAAGVFATPWLIELIAPGFQGTARQLTIRVVQILFPGAALLVFSAWCLGILNSHRKFFLSYAAPVVWNLAMIATLVWGGRHHTQARLAILLAIGSVIGSALTFLVQLPTVLRFLWPLKLRMNFGSEHVKTVTRNFFPVFVSRGVVQISAYVDAWLGSFLGTAAVAALAYAQTLYTLPVSLFGMAVSAAELPAMSSALGSAEEIAADLRRRIRAGIEQIAFFVIPSAVAFVLLGDVVVGFIYHTGHFQRSDVLFVWAVLAGSAVGLLASTSGRLYSSAFYALRDTRTPLRFAVLRVTLTFGLGYLCALPLPRLLGLDKQWGTAGLTLSAGIAGWLEFVLLRSAMNRRIGRIPSNAARIVKLWAIAVLAAALGWGIRRELPFHQPLLVGPCVLIPYAATYLLVTHRMGIASLGAVQRALRRR
jgi:putative peptidoglycan lipid II flippase